MAAKTLTKKDNDILNKARKRLQQPLDVDSMLLKLGVREQSAQARRLAASEASNPKRAQAWRRLAALLFSMASARPKMAQRATQFYIPDGKYQQQVFALDDAADGTLVICCENILENAIKAELVAPQAGDPTRFLVMGTPYAITIEQIDGKTENPPAYGSAMTGWNRKALKITLPSEPSAEQLEAVELICALTSFRWQPE